MQTDRLFHEYFQLVTEAFFELLQIKRSCPYRFTSPVIKAGERRLDGLLEPVEPGHRRYFVEIQGYRDNTIYWRVLHQVGLYHEQRPELNGNEWQAVVLFLDAAHDPGPETLGPLNNGAMPWLMRGYLPDLLTVEEGQSPVLNVLRPLVMKHESDVPQLGPRWTSAIRLIPEIDAAMKERLLALMVQFIMQKFISLTHREITTMLQLRPIEESVAYQELVQQGVRKGEITILAHLIGQKFAIPDEEIANQLAPLRSEDLKALSAYIWRAENYEQIEAWVDGRLAV